MSERSGSPISDGNFRRVKRAKKKKDDQSQKISESSQSKITQFFRTSNKLTIIKKTPKPTEIMISKLQRQLQDLRDEEDKFIEKGEELQQQYYKERFDFENYMKKSKNIIADCMLSLHQTKRKRRAMIDHSKGFFNEGMTSNFIQGSYGQDVLRKIKNMKSQLQKPQALTKQQREFIQERIKKEQRQLGFIQGQIKEYKQGLKLSAEEKHCIFSGQWPLLNKRYQSLQLLGKGGFSQVYLGYDLQNKQYVALKLSCLTGFKAQNCHYLIREYQTHQQLDHPNIAKLYQYMDYGSDKICIVLELCEGPQLSKYMEQKGVLSQRQSRNIIKQIISAIKYLSTLDNKVIHYDLKPQNIIFHRGIIKILDFGLCKQIEDEHSKIALTNLGVGTFWYLPPQSFKDNNSYISNKVDIWSAGIILYEMIFGKKPFGHNLSQTNVFNQGVILSAFKVEFPQEPHISDNCKQFINGCLAYEHTDRFSAAQAMQHIYLKQQ